MNEENLIRKLAQRARRVQYGALLIREAMLLVPHGG